MSLALVRHYKGGWYISFGVANDSTNRHHRMPVVIYLSLRNLQLHVRDAREFYSEVYHHHETQPRFRRIFPWHKA